MDRACEIMDQFILRQPPTFAEFAAAFNRPGDQHVLQYGARFGGRPGRILLRVRPCRAACALGLIGTMRGPLDAGTAYVKLYHTMGMATG